MAVIVMILGGAGCLARGPYTTLFCW